MNAEELNRLRYMIRNKHLESLKSYLQNRSLNMTTYIKLAEYALTYGQLEIKQWLDVYIVEKGVDNFNRPACPEKRVRS